MKEHNQNSHSNVWEYNSNACFLLRLSTRESGRKIREAHDYTLTRMSLVKGERHCLLMRMLRHH